MFIAGAYQPDTSISSAILPILSPNFKARFLFQVLAIITADGNPTEPIPVKLLLIEAGPSQSTVMIFPTLEAAAIIVSISEIVSSSNKLSH